jgi:hypothetical protein
MVNSSGMVEVMASDKVILPQSNIVDVVFILPVFKVEQGTFYMSSSKLIYFKRYCVTATASFGLAIQIYISGSFILSHSLYRCFTH